MHTAPTPSTGNHNSAAATLGPDEKLALVTLRTALDSLRVAEQACMAADFGSVHVLGPLERMRAELAEVIDVVMGRA
jgi:hypothetical protein